MMLRFGQSSSPRTTASESTDIKANTEIPAAPNLTRNIRAILGNQRSYVEIRAVKDLPVAAKIAGDK
ncbi:hypothetical protein [Bradyrhizobium sp. USDA 4473]